MFENLNKTFENTVKEGINTKDLDYKPLKDFVGKTVIVDGYFFNDKGRYGRQVVVVGHEVNSHFEWLINMPARYVEQFEAINSDSAMLESVLNGGLRLEEIEMVDTKNGMTTACKFVG